MCMCNVLSTLAAVAGHSRMTVFCIVVLLLVVARGMPDTAVDLQATKLANSAACVLAVISPLYYDSHSAD